MRVRSLITGGAIIVAGAFGIAGPAVAATSWAPGNQHPTLTQTNAHQSFRVSKSGSTRITNDPDSNEVGGTWADDNFTRTISIKGATSVATSYCGGTATKCYSYTGVLTDKGTFTVIKGAGSPAHNVTEARSATGSFNGGSKTVKFYASALPAKTPPRSINLKHQTKLSSDNWVEYFFATGTQFGTGPSLGSWSWTYTLPRDGNQTAQKWVDALSGSKGDIVTVALRHHQR